MFWKWQTLLPLTYMYVGVYVTVFLLCFPENTVCMYVHILLSFFLLSLLICLKVSCRCEDPLALSSF